MEKSSQKIGVGIITFNRPEYYQKVFKSIPKDKIDFLVVVNDGENVYVDQKDANTVIHNKKQLGVAVSKNKALKELIDLGCQHLFLIEDDILIKNDKVFDEYIKAANSTGIHHLCYEKVAGNEKTLKYVHEQPDGIKIGFYHNPQGAFMYINANLIKKLGYFDENYTNAFEHIDFAYNLIKKKVAPHFWYFPDLYSSEEYLTDIEGSSQNSSITNKEKYQENWQKSAEFFTKKWGYFTNEIKDEGIKKLLLSLIKLQTNYSRKLSINQDKKLAVIVPYRDREEALNKLIPSLKNVLSKQVKNFKIFVVEQHDDKLFNKGLLNNIAFLLNPDFDYYCFHDVDLIPEIADYSYPETPVHMSTYCSQFNYIKNPDATMGGVIVFKKEHFEAANGYPNDYIGWGSEDRTLGLRVEKANLKIYTHPFGKFYSVPHKSRLENQIEYDAHYVNGQKREDERTGKTDIWKNGLSTINLNNFIIEKEKKENFTHMKIKNNLTITKKYNFKVLKNQGHEEVWEYYQDDSEIDLIENFEKNTLELKKDNSPYIMIEVGSNQAYYSLLFKHILGKKNTINIMIEPYMPYLELGKKHFDINECEGYFYNNSIGNDWVIQTNQSIKNFQTEPITLFKIFEDHQLTKIDVLHFDIDGSEVKLLIENKELFLNKKIKHVYILTHSDIWHEECKQFFKNLDYKLYLDIPFYKRQVGADGLLIYKLNE